MFYMHTIYKKDFGDVAVVYRNLPAVFVVMVKSTDVSQQLT